MTKEAPTLRLFVALELPDAWHTALGRLQEEMRAGLRQRFGDSVRPRWVRPEGMHLTLKFLGETPAGHVESIQVALTRALPSLPAISLEMGNVGSFAGRRSPRVILATLGGDTRSLIQVTDRIETWLAAAGFPRERRAFQPHITLARLPETLDDATRAAIAEVTTAYAPPPVPPWPVERVSLMQSRLGPGGARYERLAAFPA